MKRMFKFFTRKRKIANFPPVPEWKPAIQQPLETIVQRMKYYTDGKSDFAVFQNGTCVVLKDGLSDSEAEASAKEVLNRVFRYHPDMNPANTDDGNVLVRYNLPVYNVVLNEIVERHWAEIDDNHQNALATSEVLITPLGSNIFDDLGKKALFGRCFMFMDALNPKVVKVVRKSWTH